MVGVLILYTQVGIAFAGGLVVIILQMFVMLIIGAWIARCQMLVMMKKNDRMKIISEVFNNIKLIKMNAWEDFFYRKLDAKRCLEVEAQKKKVFSRISLLFFLWLTP